MPATEGFTPGAIVVLRSTDREDEGIMGGLHQVSSHGAW